MTIALDTADACSGSGNNDTSHRCYLFSCSYEVFTLKSALKRHKRYRHAVTPVSQQSSK